MNTEQIIGIVVGSILVVAFAIFIVAVYYKTKDVKWKRKKKTLFQ